VAGPDSVARIAIQAWAEALRDPSFAEFVEYAYRSVREQFVTIARRAQAAGHLPPGADPEAAGAALFALVPGYILQRTITGSPDQTTFATGLRAILPPSRSERLSY
jgi:hypothetical protein